MRVYVTPTQSMVGARGTRFRRTTVLRSLLALPESERVIIDEMVDGVASHPPGSVILRRVTGPDATPTNLETRWAAPGADLTSAIGAAKEMLS